LVLKIATAELLAHYLMNYSHHLNVSWTNLYLMNISR